MYGLELATSVWTSLQATPEIRASILQESCTKDAPKMKMAPLIRIINHEITFLSSRADLCMYMYMFLIE